MALWKPTRRELIRTAPLALGAAAMPRRVWAAAGGDPLRFMVLGDWGRRGKYEQPAVAKCMRWAASTYGAHFIVTTGDNFYQRGVWSRDESHWRESYIDVYTDLVRLPWFPALGNHDYTGNPEAQLGGHDGTLWWMPARNYVIKGSHFGHPQVDLFIVDVTTWEGGNSFPQGLISVKPRPESVAAVHRWLPEQLEQSRAPIKLVFGHHGIYSVGTHGGIRERLGLEEVLKNGGVTAYVHGHDHCLYHIRDPLLDYVCSGGGSKLDGPTDYTGGGYPGCVLVEQCPKVADSAPVGEEWRNYAVPPAGSPSWLHYERQAGFALFEVWPDRVDFRFMGPGVQKPYRASIPIRTAPQATPV